MLSSDAITTFRIIPDKALFSLKDKKKVFKFVENQKSKIKNDSGVKGLSLFIWNFHYIETD